ncbi:MAG: DUF2163 domain-containing protein [Alphaproteobacteria bacterium]
MQTLSTDLAAHIAQEVTTLATCWRIQRLDGAAFCFTDHDKDLTVGGQTYLADSGMTPSAVTSQIDLAVDNMEFEGMLSADSLTEADVLSGLFDHATVSIFMVNYADATMGTLGLKTGYLGEVRIENGYFVAEMRGLASVLAQTIGEVYTPTCRAKLGDARCGIDLSGFTVTGTLTNVEASHAFTDSARTEANDYFSYGVITFTSGANNGLSMEIRSFQSGRFSLFLPMPYLPSAGDTYTAVAGCDKLFGTCVSRFSNAVNFRGEPTVPGTDAMLETAGTFKSS